MDKDKITGHLSVSSSINGKLNINGTIGGGISKSGSSANSKFVIVENESELPDYLTARDRRMYFSVEDEQFFLWNGEEWVDEMASLTEEQMLTLKNML